MSFDVCHLLLQNRSDPRLVLLGSNNGIDYYLNSSPKSRTLGDKSGLQAALERTLFSLVPLTQETKWSLPLA